LLALCVATALSCGHKSGVGPTPIIEDPAVSCPSDISATAHNGQNPTVDFDTPTALNGLPPITVVCTPGSGTEFPVGTTSVTCEATDARAHRGSCSFAVNVTAVPRLAKTKFLALGDSLTEGKTRLTGGTIVQLPPNIFNASGSYPDVLEAKLTARYEDQTITMIPYGWGGEKAAEGAVRLQRHWAEFNPEVVLLFEGANDLTTPEAGTAAGMAAAINSVIDALRTDIVFAKSRGAQVFVATLMPMTPPRGPNVIAAVPALNARIKTLAEEKRVPFVDLYTAIPTDMISTTDGTHPKPGSEVYNMMADEWLKAITATLEVKEPVPEEGGEASTVRRRR
jgi:lysophospholipase L1-like esterase